LAISTHQLKSLRILHPAPIKVVVYDQPSVLADRDTYFRGGLGT